MMIFPLNSPWCTTKVFWYMYGTIMTSPFSLPWHRSGRKTSIIIIIQLVKSSVEHDPQLISPSDTSVLYFISQHGDSINPKKSLCLFFWCLLKLVKSVHNLKVHVLCYNYLAYKYRFLNVTFIYINIFCLWSQISIPNV